MRKVTVGLKFITAVTGVETSFEILISDRTRKQCPIPRCLSYIPFPDEHTLFIHPKSLYYHGMSIHLLPISNIPYIYRLAVGCTSIQFHTGTTVYQYYPSTLKIHASTILVLSTKIAA